jgi:hypothetical protein
VQDVSELFNLVDKYARAVEGHTSHSQLVPEVGKAGKPDADVAAQSSGKKKRKKKFGGKDKPLAGAPTAAAEHLVGVVAHVVTSGRDSPPAVMRAVHSARCTTPSVTTRRNAGKSRSLRSSSTSNKSYSFTMMAHLLGSGRASSRLSRRMTRRRMRK